MKRHFVIAAALGLLALPVLPALAQQSSAPPTFGTADLRSGFTPDPHDVALRAGGSVDASVLGADCRGSIAARPDFALRYQAGSLPLFLSVTSATDTTIAVLAPNGSWVCNDDGAGNFNPGLQFQRPATGDYKIWVGTFAGGSALPEATLHISELGFTQPPAPVQAQTPAPIRPDPSLAPAYGVVALVSGFTPDPHTRVVSAGGGIDASVLAPSCVGFIAQKPDYRVNWTAGSSGLPLVFSVLSDADTVLVINDAQGNWICDDDGAGGLNPAIRFTSPTSGAYDVWVGTFVSGSLPRSTLNVSELGVAQASAPAVAANLSGTWAGSYSGGGNPLVHFELTLNGAPGQFTGRMSEENLQTANRASNSHLFASVSGQARADRTISFVKTYDGTAGVGHSVQYAGTIDPAGATITGTWSIGATSGQFQMARR